MTHLQNNRFCSDFTLNLYECEKRTGLRWACWALRTLSVRLFNRWRSHITLMMWRLIIYVLLFPEHNRLSRQSEPIKERCGESLRAKRHDWLPRFKRCEPRIDEMIYCMSFLCCVNRVEHSRRPTREAFIHRWQLQIIERMVKKMTSFQLNNT